MGPDRDREVNPGRPRARLTIMRRFAWVWYAGTAAWLVDAFVSLRLHATQHATLAFMLSLVFFAAAIFYSQQRR